MTQEGGEVGGDDIENDGLPHAVRFLIPEKLAFVGVHKKEMTEVRVRFRPALVAHAPGCKFCKIAHHSC